MTPEIYNQLQATLRAGPRTLEHLHALVLEAGSTWSEAQLRLLLTCIDGIEVDDTDNSAPVVRLGQRTEQELLVDAMLEVLHSKGGGPLHPGELKRLLPTRFTTTEEQLRALARKTNGLQVMGPGLIRSGPTAHDGRGAPQAASDTQAPPSAGMPRGYST